jgi:hypothetical protein
MRASWLLLFWAAASTVRAVYWMEQIAHRGKSAFNPDASYQVFRNVKDFGAVGDGGEESPRREWDGIAKGWRLMLWGSQR